MIGSFSIKTWVMIIFLPVVFIFSVLLLVHHSDIYMLSEYAVFRYMPYILTGIGFILGLFFSQSRVSFISFFLAFVFFITNYFFFIKPDSAKGITAVFLSTIYISLLTVLFFRLKERGLFTIHGLIRILIVGSAILVILFLSEFIPLDNNIYIQGYITIGDSLHLSRRLVSEILIFTGCIPFFLIRVKNESLLMGPIFMIMVLFALVGLNFQAYAYSHKQIKFIFIFFTLCSAITPIFIVMESAWRNASIDELTEIHGRRAMDRHLARLRSFYAIAMVDIDYFKKINDKYGHDTGDQVLRFIAVKLKKNTAGKPYRYGGEEFAIICEHNDFNKTVSLIKELREDISSTKFILRSKLRPKKKPEKQYVFSKETKILTITVSIGVAGSGDRYKSSQQVLEAADKALYRAKKNGRNCVKTT